MLLFDRRRQHHDLAGAARRQRKASLGRAHVCQRPKLHAKPPDFDPQPCAMRFIGVLRPEGASEERAPRHVSGPRFAQRAGEREQYRTRRERDHRACVPHDIAACVHDERPRPQQRFYLLEQEGTLLSTRNQARGGRVQDEGSAFDLRRQREDVRLARGLFRPSERSARRLCPKAPNRDSRYHQLVGGPQRGWERRGIEPSERALGLVEATDQEQAPDLEILRMRGIQAVAVRFERRPRCVERLGRPGEVARDERDLGLGDDTPRAGYRLLRTEGARSASQERLARTRSPSCAIAMPRSASAGASSRRATRFNAPRGSPAASARAAAVISESIWNPVTLVTPTVRRAGPIYLMADNER